MPKPVLVNIHIPYCIRREKYIHSAGLCGTNEEKNAYLEAVMRELKTWEGELEGCEVRAVRLCGGSATVMSPDLLGKTLATARRVFPMARGAEVSFDANPLTICTPALTGIANGQPNRAELMVRSFNDDELKAMNCAFDTQNIRNALLFFNRFRLNNVSLTLTYGFPEQTEHSWFVSVTSAVNNAPRHIRIQRAVPEEDVQMPDDDTCFRLYENACDILQKAGYTQYSRDGFAVGHGASACEYLSLGGAEIIGVGLGAVTCLDGCVSRNTDNLRLYVKNAGDPEKLVAKAAELTEAESERLYVSGRLQLTEGVDPALAEQRLGHPLSADAMVRLTRLADAGLVTVENGRYAPTRRGLFEAERA